MRVRYLAPLALLISLRACFAQDLFESVVGDSNNVSVAAPSHGGASTFVAAMPTPPDAASNKETAPSDVEKLLEFEFKLAPVELDISEELVQAKIHYEAGRWKAAVASATNFLSKHPDHKQVPNALFLRGESNVQLKHYNHIIADFQQLLKRRPNLTQRMRAEFRIAEAELLLQRYDAAKPKLEDFRRKYPHDKLNAYVITYLGEILSREDNQRAKALFEESLRRYPFGPLQRRAKLQLALLDFKEGNYVTAREDLEQLIETSKSSTPDFWTAWYWLARTELKLQEPTSLERFLALVEQNPNHEYAAAATYQVAEILREQGKLEQATERYEQIRREWRDGQFASVAALGLMQVYQQQGRYQEALELLDDQDGFSSPPTQMLARQVAAEIYLSQQRFRLAEELIRPHTMVQPSLKNQTARTNYYHNVYLLALALRGQGKYSPAIELLGRVRLDLVSTEMAQRVNLARVETFVAAEEYERAIQVASDFEARYPSSGSLPALREQMIRSLLLSERTDEASSKFQQLQKMPGAEAYLIRSARLLGETAYQAGDFANARIAFQALKRNQQSDQDLTQALSGLAWLDYKQNNLESAIGRFKEFVDGFPNHPSIWQMRLAMARSLALLDRRQEAIETLEAFESASKDAAWRARGLYQLAELLSKETGQRKRAARIMQWILTDHPEFEHRDAALYVCGMYERRLNDSGGIAKLNELVQRFPSSKYWSDALYRLAESAHAIQDHVAANAYLTKIITSNLDRQVMPHALFMKGRLESDEKNWTQARETLRELLRNFPGSKLTPVARYGVAESFFQEKDFARAHQLFQILDADQPFKPGDSWGAMVQLRLAQLEVHRKNLPRAIEIAQPIRQDYPGFALQHEVDYLIGRVAAARGEFSTARTAYDKVVAADGTFDREITAMAQWMIGETYFHQKKYELAIKAYEALVADLKFDNWRAASHLQIGKCHELLNNPIEAEKSYSRVTTTYSTSKWAKEAEVRLRELRQSI